MNARVYFEIMPFGRGEEEAAALPESAQLTVTCSPKHGIDHSAAVAERLRALGHSVTMHLAARMVGGPSHLDALLSALSRAGIEDIFLIGGDAAVPAGPYGSALELLPLLHEHSHRPRTIGIAGYPEGHPLIDAATLARSLKDKCRFADSITTQLCFNEKAIFAWVEETRHRGISLPVIVGLPGVVDRRKLLEIAVRVGVGPSISFIRKQGGLRNLLCFSSNSVERLHRALAPCVGSPSPGIAGFHYFTFNRLVDTWRWDRAHAHSASVDSVNCKEVTPR